MQYMLDTNIVSYLLRGSFPNLEEKIRTIPDDELCISVVSRAELQYGVARLKNAMRLKNLVQEFLASVHTLSWGTRAADHYAVLRADLQGTGKVIGSLDMLIAAHALSEGATLITNNSKEFNRVNNLRVEDWTQSS